MDEALYDNLTVDQLQTIDSVCTDFERRWRAGQPVAIEDIVRQHLSELQPILQRDLAGSEIQLRIAAEESFGPDEYVTRFPDWAQEIRRLFAETEETQCLHSVDTQSPGTPDKDSDLPRDFGQYRLQEQIGQGGMGTVYRAEHVSLRKDVALKMLNPATMENAAAVARFQREMEAIGKLDHPHIVRALDGGQIDGVYYLTMEFVDGYDLRQISLTHGRLRYADACELICQAAIALQEAHEHGMVHRDIKPSNLILAKPRRTGQKPVLRVLDLGLALLETQPTPSEHATAVLADVDTEEFGSLEVSGSLSVTGNILGTVDYMAPEQAVQSSSVDIRADIYALGATLFRLLAGHPPMQGTSPVRVMQQKLGQNAPSLGEVCPDLPAKLVQAVDRTLQKDPDDRFAEPSDVITALRPFCQDANAAALLGIVPSEPETAESDGQSTTAKAVVGGLVASLLAVLTYFAVINRMGTEDSLESTPIADAIDGAEIDGDAAAENSEFTLLTNGWRIGVAENLGPIVNSDVHDANPTLSADGKTLLFYSQRDSQPGVWMADRENGNEVWNIPTPFDWPLLGFERDPSPHLSGDGLVFLFIADMDGSHGQTDLWQIERKTKSDPWGEPQNLGDAVNSEFGEFGPCFSSDGRILMFSSFRDGGYGESDLWMSFRPDRSAEWGKPVNLGPVVNCKGGDGSPTLSTDGLTLVFESSRDGSIGVGDLWMSTRASLDDSWSEPVNLGAGVNSPTWDAAPEFSTDDSMLYFSTRRSAESRSNTARGADVWRVRVRAPPEPVVVPVNADDESTGHRYRTHRKTGELFSTV